MPAEFLVDREGAVAVAYYGTDEGDHLPFEEIVRFAGVMSGSITPGIEPGPHPTENETAP
jgi:hypothetical protein